MIRPAGSRGLISQFFGVSVSTLIIVADGATLTVLGGHANPVPVLVIKGLGQTLSRWVNRGSVSR